MSMTTYTHPRWCDPRLCEHTGSNLDHRAATLTWKPNADDAHFTVGLGRLDEVDDFSTTGPTNVVLVTDNDFSERIEVDLSVADARMLAAALIAAAERADYEAGCELL